MLRPAKCTFTVVKMCSKVSFPLIHIFLIDLEEDAERVSHNTARRVLAII